MPPSPFADEASCDVSVVVCTFNRASMLRDALDSLVGLAADASFTYEIVVIDNASTDDTAQVATAFAARADVPVRYALETKKGIASARNRGLREAKGLWIAFFDDDQLADPQWLRELLAIAHEKNVRCAGGRVRVKLLAQQERRLHPFVQMLLGEADWAPTPVPYSLKRTPGCGNLIVHRDALNRVGGFDEAFQVRAEDTDLFRRIHLAGFAAWYTPRAIVDHCTPPNRLEPAYLHRLCRMMGEGLAEREREDRSSVAFALRWFAKWARMTLIQRARRAWALLRGDRETALACDCQIALSSAYHDRGRELLASPRFAGWSSAKT